MRGESGAYARGQSPGSAPSASAGGSLLSGLADLLPRRQVMVACDLIRVVSVGLMAIRGVPFWALCALLFCTVLLSAPFASARSALIPDILSGEQIAIGSAVGNITHQASQILGFVTGAAVVATLDPYRALGIDACTFGISALILLAAIRPRPTPPREPEGRPAMWSVSADGIRIVLGNPVLRTLLLFGWLAGFYIVPEGLAAPSAQVRIMGWIAMASCAPLVGSAWDPPLGIVIVLWLFGRSRARMPCRDSASSRAARSPTPSARPWPSAWPGCSGCALLPAFPLTGPGCAAR
ncbi:MAG TPA: MFS transporter [Trebonia sp.]